MPEQVEESLGVKLADLYSGSAASLRVLAVAAESDGYRLRQRALHVWMEAARVLEFKSLAEVSTYSVCACACACLMSNHT